MLKILVCIPTYNGYYRVDWLLNSIALRKDENIDFKIIVCDDSGKDSHRRQVEAVVNKWKNDNRIGHLLLGVLINEKNLGLATTWNRLARSYDSEQIMFINDDIIVSKGWLSSMVYFLENNPNAGSVSEYAYFITKDDIGPLLSSSYTIVVPRNPYDKKQTEKYSDGLEYPGLCMCPAGCMFGITREKFNLVGGFDEKYFAFYEETDLGTSLASKGFGSYCLSWPRNWHLWSATFGEAPEINAGMVMENSRVYYTRKWGSHTDITHPRYMSKIPFRKIKFMYRDRKGEDQLYEKIIDGKDGSDGYFANDEDRRNVGILTRLK